MRREEQKKRLWSALQLELVKVNTFPALLKLGKQLGDAPPLYLVATGKPSTLPMTAAERRRTVDVSDDDGEA